MPKQKKIDESRTSALRFCKLTRLLLKVELKIISSYLLSSAKCCCSPVGRQKFVRDVLNAAPLTCERDEEVKRERLHFYRPAANSHIPERQTPSTTNRQAKPSWQNLKKRPRQSEKCDSSRQSPPAKRLSSSAFTAEDIDLLSSYWGMCTHGIPQSRAESSTSMSVIMEYLVLNEQESFPRRVTLVTCKHFWNLGSSLCIF